MDTTALNQAELIANNKARDGIAHLVSLLAKSSNYDALHIYGTIRSGVVYFKPLLQGNYYAISDTIFDSVPDNLKMYIKLIVSYPNS